MCVDESKREILKTSAKLTSGAVGVLFNLYGKVSLTLIYSYELICLNFDGSCSCTCIRAGRLGPASITLVGTAQVRKHPRMKVGLGQGVLVVRAFL